MSVKRDVDIYQGRDPREIAAYNVSEAALYLGLPVSTVRSWVDGRDYKHLGRSFLSVVVPAEKRPIRLSFINLVEIHVLRSVREAGVPLRKVRSAVEELQSFVRSLPDTTPAQAAHPLAYIDVLTDGVDVFVRDLGALVSLNHGRQVVIKEIVESHLRRIDRDPSTGQPMRLRPFVGPSMDEQSPFSIDPRVRFGRLCLAGTGIAVDEVIGRFVHEESIAELQADFERPRGQIESALRFAVGRKKTDDALILEFARNRSVKALAKSHGQTPAEIESAIRNALAA